MVVLSKIGWSFPSSCVPLVGLLVSYLGFPLIWLLVPNLGLPPIRLLCAKLGLDLITLLGYGAIVDKLCSYENSPWGKLGEMSLPSWSWVETLVMVAQEGLPKGDHLTRGTLAQ